MSSRDVYIWGAGHAGRTASRRLRGRAVRGFVDSNPRLWDTAVDGILVWAPSAVLAAWPRPFIVVASMFEDAIAASLTRAGWVAGADFASAADVVGTTHDDAVHVFDDVYARNAWADTESRSGGGSALCATGEVRAALPRLFRKYGIRSVLDAPCGDLNWMQTLLPEIADYTGLDIVASLVEQNRTRYGSPSVRFVLGDVARDPLPPADLILVRDCLVHVSTGAAIDALRNIARTQASYLLVTTFPDCAVNRDVLTGGWRPLNLQRAPFDLGAPLEWVHERAPGPDGAFADKALGLWAIGDLRRSPLCAVAA
jgi:SAM-dependent methyltransferase